MSRLQNSYLKSTTNFEIKLIKNLQAKENELKSLIEFDEVSSTKYIEDPSSTDLESIEALTSRTDLINMKPSIEDLEPRKSRFSNQDLELSKSRITDDIISKLIKSNIDIEYKSPSTTGLEPLKARMNLDQNSDWTFELASFKLECPSPWIYIVTNAHVKRITNRRCLARDGVKVDIFFRNVQSK